MPAPESSPRPESETLKVFVIEDHENLRRKFEMFLNSREGLSCVGVAGQPQEALEAVPRLEPDVALIDLSLPVMDGLELVRELMSRRPGLRCLIISGYDQSSYVAQAFDAGAVGYVLKGDPAEMVDAIQTVCAGGRYVSKRLS